MRRLAAALVATTAALAACTSSAPSSPTTSTEVQTITRTTTPPPSSAAPVSAGPTTASAASSCPLLDTPSAVATGGMRLDKISVLRSGGKTVGCRFFALQHPNDQCSATCLAAEKLPGPTQPVIEITSMRYPNATLAHNAFVLLAGKGTNAQQAEIASGNTGLCFQTAFYPPDKGKDWACTYSVGTTLVLVTTVATLSFTAIQVTKAVAASF